MIQKIHHIGIAVHSLDAPPVILSGDYALVCVNASSRRNLGWGRRILSGSRGAPTLSPPTEGGLVIEKIHHMGIAVHSLDAAPVILSGDYALVCVNASSRRNLGWGRRSLSGSRGAPTLSPAAEE